MKTNNKKTKGEQFDMPIVGASFSLEDVKKIASDAMNLGLELRQDQLNGYDVKSGDEVMKEYFDNLQTYHTKKQKL